MIATVRSARILHVAGELAYGGVESTILSLIRMFPTAEHIVAATGGSLGPRAPHFQRVALLEHVPYEPPHRMTFIRDLESMLRRVAPTHILCHNFGNHLFVCLAARNMRLAKPLTVVQANVARDTRGMWKNLLLAHAARPINACEIATSEHVARDLRDRLKLPAYRVKVIPNSTAPSRRPHIPSKDGTVRVVMVARMDDAKDQGTVLRAVSSLKKQGLRLEVTFIGDGPRRAEHERLRNDLDLGTSVRFAGDVADIPGALAEADIFVLATHTESLPIAMMEAMSAGVPVIASNIPGTRELLADTGTLVPPEDPEALARAIGAVVRDPDSARRLASRAKERVTRHYSPNAVRALWAKALDL